MTVGGSGTYTGCQSSPCRGTAIADDAILRKRDGVADAQARVAHREHEGSHALPIACVAVAGSEIRLISSWVNGSVGFTFGLGALAGLRAIQSELSEKRRTCAAVPGS
jgi:hypothetical protein